MKARTYHTLIRVMVGIAIGMFLGVAASVPINHSVAMNHLTWHESVAMGIGNTVMDGQSVIVNGNHRWWFKAEDGDCLNKGHCGEHGGWGDPQAEPFPGWVLFRPGETRPDIKYEAQK